MQETKGCTNDKKLLTTIKKNKRLSDDMSKECNQEISKNILAFYENRKENGTRRMNGSNLTGFRKEWYQERR